MRTQVQIMDRKKQNIIYTNVILNTNSFSKSAGERRATSGNVKAGSVAGIACWID